MLRVGRSRSSLSPARLMRAESAVGTPPPPPSLPAAPLVRAGAECVCVLRAMRAAERERDGAAEGCCVGWAGPCLQKKQIRVGPRFDFCGYTFLSLPREVLASEK